ncbi:MAG: ABC transporter permease [Bacteroidetes bacterium]|nr:ABC transporter permease [Bacteroidota bacterium]MCL5025377.1 ABC transporter permease [Chloroflexota bacterium]
MSILLIARLTLKEAARKRLLALAVAGGALFLVLFGVGFALLLGQIKAEAARAGGGAPPFMLTAMMMVMGFYFLNVLAGVSAIFVSVNAISGELDSGTIHALVARPLRRRDIILGKWLGYALVLTAYVVAMSTGLMAIIYLTSGTLPPAPLATIGLMVWVALLLLTLSILGGTFLSALANGVGLFLLYGLAWLAGVIEGLGGLVHNSTMVHIGIAVSLLVPSDALWQAASYYLQSPSILMLASTSASGLFPFGSSAPPAGTMLVYTTIYTLAALGLAVLVFSRRDM